MPRARAATTPPAADRRQVLHMREITASLSTPPRRRMRATPRLPTNETRLVPAGAEAATAAVADEASFLLIARRVYTDVIVQNRAARVTRHFRRAGGPPLAGKFTHYFLLLL